MNSHHVPPPAIAAALALLIAVPGSAQTLASAAGMAAARASRDSPSAPARQALSPGAATALGCGATLAPALAAAVLYPHGNHSGLPSEVALGVGATLGLFVGPAVGLYSGGRGDLAAKGLILRSVGLAAGGVAAVALVSQGESIDPRTGFAFALLGGVGGLVAALSGLHDLCITPSATAEGRSVRPELGVRPDGRVALTLRF